MPTRLIWLINKQKVLKTYNKQGTKQLFLGSNHKDGGILSKDGFGTSHPLDHGSLRSSKGLGCNCEIADNGHVGKEILSNDVDRCH